MVELKPNLEEGQADNKISTVPRSIQENIISTKFRIQVQHPINELSDEFVKYFLATDSENNQEFYAIVFDRTFNPNISLISSIYNSNEGLFTKVIAYEIAKLSVSKTACFVVIVEKFNHQENLLNFIKKNGAFSDRQIKEKLIPFLIRIVQFCESNSTIAGNINLRNILIHNEEFILREPYTAPSYYHQIPSYLPVELLDCHALGRKTDSTAADIYDIGVTVLETMGVNISALDNNNQAQYERLNSSSFSVLVNKHRLSEEFKNLLKGCLNDSVNDRWRLKMLIDWSNGKSLFNKIIPSLEHNDSVTPISFNGRSYSNFRALASDLFNNWELGLAYIQEERLLKWIQRNIGKNKTIEHIDELLSKGYSLPAFLSKSIDKEERLSKVLMALDNQGPIRYNNFATTLESIPNLIVYGITKQKRYITDNIIKVILKKNWNDIQKYNPKAEINASYIELLEEISQSYNSQTPGCGVERILYDLNPSLPCLGPLITDEYLTNLSDVLSFLDKLASQNPNRLVFDRHVISFIAHKINLKRENYVKLVKDCPQVAENSIIHSLAIISLAIQQEKGTNVSNLVKFLGIEIIKFLDGQLHNMKLKKILNNKIQSAIDNNNLTEILKIISNQKIYKNDQIGYYKATRDVSQINLRINSLSNNSKVSRFGTLFGQRITVLVSYFLFIIITLGMVF